MDKKLLEEYIAELKRQFSNFYTKYREKGQKRVDKARLGGRLIQLNEVIEQLEIFAKRS